MKIALCTWTLFLSLSMPIAAQTISGAITGEVIDPSGRVLAASAVTLTNTGLATDLRTKTNEFGVFDFVSLMPGTYQITVEAPGFKKMVRTGIELTANQRLSTGVLKLDVGSVSESVTVSGRAEVVQAVSSERSANISQTQLKNLPMFARDPTELVLLLPGFVSTGGYRPAYQAPEALREYTSNGGRANNKNFTVDGVTAVNFLANQNASVTPTADAVEQVEVQISNYQAEHGRTSGASINMITKSGTQEFHGSAYVYILNEAFNANGFLANRAGAVRAKSRLRTEGFTLGGPVMIPRVFNTGRRKLFFFFSESKQPLDFPGAVQQLTMPTALERQGDFSQTRTPQGALIAVRDPLNGQPFAANRVPANRISPFGQSILNIYPLPNITDPTGRNQFNYQIRAVNRLQPRHEQVAKVDYNITPKVTLYGRYVRDRNDVITDFMTNFSGTNTLLSRPGHNFSLHSGQTLSPSLVNEVTFGYNKLRSETRPSSDAAYARVKRATVNMPLTQLNPSTNPDGQVPAINFGAPLSGSLAPSIGQPFNLSGMYGFSFLDNLAKIRGPHTFKFGFYAERTVMNDQPASLYSGSFNFNAADAVDPGNTGYPYANALIGNFNTYSEVSKLQQNSYRNVIWEWYAQDTWRVTRKLTLELGMRFYVHPPDVDANGALAGFDPAAFDRSKTVRLYQPFNSPQGLVARDPLTGNIVARTLQGAIVPGSGTTGNGMVSDQDSSTPRGLYKNRGVHFGPRVGFAYDPFGKGETAIRGGFGFFYDRNAGRLVQSFASNPPFVLTPVIYYGNIANLSGSGGVTFPQGVTGVDREGQVPTTMNFSLGVQHNVKNLFVVDVAYAGSLARHLQEIYDYNTTPFGTNFLRQNENPTSPGRALPANFLRPYPGYDFIRITRFSSNSSYHSLQTQVKRRFGRRVMAEGVWTWSKAMDYGDSDTAIRSSLLPRWRDYGKAGFDATHVFNINFSYEFPHVSPYLRGNKVVKAIADNWRLSGFGHFISGYPFPVNFSAAGADFTGSTEAARVNLTANPILPKDQRTFFMHFNTPAIARPTPGVFGVTTAQTVDFGNAPKDVYRSPGIEDWDMGLTKTIILHEKHRLDLHGEFYNIFNQVSWRRPDNNATFDANGRQINPTFGQYNNANGARAGQVGLRYSF